jgi:hypothetical protein
MSRIIAFLVLFAVASLGSVPLFAGDAGCAASSWNPEEYAFYGAKDSIAEKLAKIPVKLAERRVFLQVTQGDSGAEVKLYERQSDGTFNVTKWTTRESSGLLADIDKAILANKGVNCVGEQVKSVLTKALKDGKVAEKVAAPESPKAGFAHSVKDASGEFIKSVVIVLC